MNWKEVWEKKSNTESNGYEIEFLNKFSKKDDLLLLEFFSKLNFHSVFECFSGNGEILHKIIPNHFDYEIGGIDYISNMENNFRKRFSDNVKEFQVKDCTDLDTSNKYDLVFLWTGLNYVDDLSKSEKIIKLMIEKSNKYIFLGDISLIDKYDEYIEYRKKIDLEFQKEMHSGTNHLLYDRNWLFDICEKYETSFSQVVFNFESYKNNDYRMNLFLEKDEKI